MNYIIDIFKKNNKPTLNLTMGMVGRYINNKIKGYNYEDFFDTIIENDIEIDKKYLSAQIIIIYNKNNNIDKLGEFIYKYGDKIDYYTIRDYVLPYSKDNNEINGFILEYYNTLDKERKKEFNNIMNNE